jgi:hypothetical protein
MPPAQQPDDCLEEEEEDFGAIATGEEVGRWGFDGGKDKERTPENSGKLGFLKKRVVAQSRFPWTLGAPESKEGGELPEPGVACR